MVLKHCKKFGKITLSTLLTHLNTSYFFHSQILRLCNTVVYIKVFFDTLTPSCSDQTRGGAITEGAEVELPDVLKCVQCQCPTNGHFKPYQNLRASRADRKVRIGVKCRGICFLLPPPPPPLLLLLLLVLLLFSIRLFFS